MKRVQLSIMLLLLVGVTHAQVKPIQSMLNSYLELKEALVNSDEVKAAESAKQLIVIINDKNELQLSADEKKVFNKEKSNLLTSAVQIHQSKDIEEQRELFDGLSISLWKVVKAAKQLDANVYYQYCPMKKAYWLSNKSIIENPYYGSSMLNCGSVSDKRLK